MGTVAERSEAFLRYGRLTKTTPIPSHRSAQEPNAGKINWQSNNSSLSGAIAQLGERVVRNDEAVGSSPTSSTKSFNNLPRLAATFDHPKNLLIGP